MLGRFLLFLFLLILASPFAFFFYTTSSLSHPEVQLVKLQSQAIGAEKNLPFYELMSPIPKADKLLIVPSIEYKKGPPDRYIEKISLLFVRSGAKAKERAIYFGRRTETNWWLSTGMQLAGFTTQLQEANFISAAIEYSIKGIVPHLPVISGPLIKVAMLRVANDYLEGAEKVIIQDQASTPAFLFINKTEEPQQKHTRSYFFRRNSQFRLDYLADKDFEILQPEDFFTKSFLVANRQDAMGFISRNLSEVQFAASEVHSISLADTSWPLALLAASLSVDPGSIDAYFHFAGLNGLLFKSKALETNDTELIDILRNNVLSAGFYAQDVAPQSEKSAEIARLARSLTRNLD